MKNHRRFLICIALLLTLVLAACGVQPKPEANSVLPDNFRQTEVTLPGFDKPQKVTYEIVDGKAYFEGDIILGNVDAEGKLIKSENNLDSQGVATNTGCFIIGLFDCHWRWPGGVIPFIINSNVSASGRANITAAIAQWQAKTAIRFVVGTTQPDFIEFTAGSRPDACASLVGRSGGRQIIELTSSGDCSKGALIHEIGHAIGLHHEQGRGDRDSHVMILWGNIENGMADQFQKYSNAFDIGSYDFNSIMHYSAFAFCKRNSSGACVGRTIQTIPAGIPIGQQSGLSGGDIAATNRLYPSYQSLGPALAPGSGVGTATRGATLDVFVRGTDNALYQKWTTNGQQWSNWVGLGGVITSNPAAVGRGQRVDAFARGTDGALWSIYWDGSQWSNWYSLGGSLAPGSGASVVTLGNNTLNVFVRWSNNQLYQRYFDGQNWGPWASMAPNLITSDPAAVVWGNYLNVFVKGTDNQLYYKHWNGQQWSNYVGIGGILTTGATAVSLSPNTLHVYARGTDGKLYENFWNGSQWQGWDVRGNHFSQADPEAVTWGGRLNVFVRGTDGDLWYRFWNGSSWQPQIP
jgi:Astacin (Peptidase family M12A)